MALQKLTQNTRNCLQDSYKCFSSIFLPLPLGLVLLPLPKSVKSRPRIQRQSSETCPVIPKNTKRLLGASFSSLEKLMKDSSMTGSICTSGDFHHGGPDSPELQDSARVPLPAPWNGSFHILLISQGSFFLGPSGIALSGCPEAKIAQWYPFSRVLRPQSVEETLASHVNEFQLPLSIFRYISTLDAVVLKTENWSLMENEREEGESRSYPELFSKDLRLPSLSVSKNKFI